MSFTTADVSKLKKLISLAHELLETAQPTSKKKAEGRQPATGKRTRRSGKELIAFRKVLKAERKKGVRVEEIASKHGVSPAYIYQLG